MKLPSFKPCFWITILILLILAIGVVFIPLLSPTFKNQDALMIEVWFIGICQIILSIGFLFFVFLLSWMGFQYYQNENKKESQVIDRKNKESDQTRLAAEAQQRRIHDEERNRVNDLFRLIELAKETTEKSESAPTIDKADKLIVKHESLNISKLKELIIHYNTLNSQSNTDQHV